VKTNIEKIGGAVDIHSIAGQGTTLKIKIPLTLAIIPALIVTSGGDRFAIPQVSLLELVRIEEGTDEQGIEMIYGAPVYRLRGNLLPLVSLNQALGLQPGFWGEGRRETVNIVVLQAGENTFGLVVDEINDTEEIVVKPLGKQLKGLAAFAGATIMGDGRVALILDVMGTALRSKVISESRDQTRTSVAKEAQAANGERHTLLLFATRDGRRMALPLSMVSRLEEFPLSAVERAGRDEIMQYRNTLLPLVRLSEVLEGGESGPPSDPMQVVVYHDQGRNVGLVVDNILDIVEETLAIHRRREGGTVYGTAVIQQKVTDLLDIGRVIAASNVVVFESSDAGALAGAEA
jgi:two-component system chemotaxis sensor kinase CheA